MHILIDIYQDVEKKDLLLSVAQDLAKFGHTVHFSMVTHDQPQKIKICDRVFLYAISNSSKQKYLQELSNKKVYDIAYGSNAEVLQKLKEDKKAKKIIFAPSISQIEIQNEIYYLADGIHVLSENEAQVIERLHSPLGVISVAPSFAPIERLQARNELGWRIHSKTVLILSNGKLPCIEKINAILQDIQKKEDYFFVPFDLKILDLQENTEVELDDKNVGILKYQSEDQLSKIFAASDLMMVFDSYQDMEKRIYQCLSCGTPVAMVQNETDIIIEGVNGSLFSANDEKAIAHSIEKLLGHYWTDETIRKEQIAKSVHLWTLKEMACSYETLFQKVHLH
jgi:glycosyltransferase involved in cell wall biosynthesis